MLAPPLGLFIVADGVGGARAGEHASKLAVETVADYVAKAGETSGAVLLEAVREANKRVLEAAAGDAMLHGMSTTLTACWKLGEELLFANVGDSRAYVYQSGELRAITEDQTWVNEVGRRLGLGDDALRTHPMRHVLTMAVGSGGNELLRIHSCAVPLTPGAQFLLCSDGLHGVVAEAQIIETLSGDATLEGKCRMLIDAAKRAGGPDNITAVLLRVAVDGTPTSG